MLTIRENQHEVLREAARVVFLDHMEKHVCTHFATVLATVKSDQLREILIRQWARANSYGLTSEMGVCSWLNVVFTLGEDFEKQPGYTWALPLLENETMVESAKLARLKTRVQAALEVAMIKEGH